MGKRKIWKRIRRQINTKKGGKERQKTKDMNKEKKT